MNSLARITVTLAAVASAALAIGSTAQAATTDLATLNNISALSAGSGYVSYSALQNDGRWHLVILQNGKPTTLKVAPRNVPFDADIGTDANGAPVITFSRCADPEVLLPGTKGFAGANGLLVQTRRVGCRLRVVQLPSGRESAITVPGTAGHSDTTPSMYAGNLAFGRTTRGAAITRLLYRAKASRTLRELPPGASPKPCRKKACLGDIQQLDIGRGRIAVLWHVWSLKFILPEAWTLNEVDVRKKTARTWASGWFSEDGGGSPASPALLPDGELWMTDLHYYDSPLASQIIRVAGGQKHTTSTEGLVWQLAVDGDTLYTVTGPAGPADSFGYPSTQPPCSGANGPCHLTSRPLAEVR